MRVKIFAIIPVMFIFLTQGVYAYAFSVQQVQYQLGNENVTHEGSCALHVFQIYRASDSSQLTDGVVGCTGDSPATEVIAPSDVLIGSLPYSTDVYIKSDDNISQTFTLVEGNYTDPTPTATPSPTPTPVLVDIASSSGLAHALNNMATLQENEMLLLIISCGIFVGSMFFFLS